MIVWRGKDSTNFWTSSHKCQMKRRDIQGGTSTLSLLLRSSLSTNAFLICSLMSVQAMTYKQNQTLCYSTNYSLSWVMRIWIQYWQVTSAKSSNLSFPKKAHNFLTTSWRRITAAWWHGGSVLALSVPYSFRFWAWTVNGNRLLINIHKLWQLWLICFRAKTTLQTLHLCCANC